MSKVLVLVVTALVVAVRTVRRGRVGDGAP